jgi:CBS domain containing-hemolysin-like protein
LFSIFTVCDYSFSAVEYLQIMPQAVCTRYGLKVGAIMAPFVRVLLVLFFPISYPISKVESQIFCFEKSACVIPFLA